MEQILNYNEEAEQIVLGSIIMNNDLLSALDVTEDDFLQVDNKRIFAFLESNITRNISANRISLKSFFAELNCGQEYLSQLMQRAQPIFAKEAAKTLRELSLKRFIGVVGADMVNMSTDAAKNSQEIKEQVIERLEDIKISKASEPVSIFAAASSAFSKEKIASISSGYRSIDAIINGFDLGDLIILAGRPGMGKSCLAANIAVNLAKKKEPVLLVSLEMKADQISKRIIANLATIHLTKLKNNNLTSQNEVEAFQRAMTETKQMPLTIEDSGGLTLQKLKYLIKRFINKTKGRLVIIDYIQLIKHKTKGGRVDDITEITNTLKDYAMEFDIVILGLSQLSRAVESRDDKRPQLSDLRDSGSLEQDASVVIFTFRPEYYLEKDKGRFEENNKLSEWHNRMSQLKGVAYAIVAKVRDGKTGDAKLYFEGEFQRFTETNF